MTKRFVCLTNGVEDLIDYQCYKGFDWRALLFMNL